MYTDLLKAAVAEVAELEKELKNHPLFQRLQAVRRVIELYDPTKGATAQAAPRGGSTGGGEIDRRPDRHGESGVGNGREELQRARGIAGPVEHHPGLIGMTAGCLAAAVVYTYGHPGFDGYRPGALDRPLQSFHREVNLVARDGQRVLSTLDHRVLAPPQRYSMKPFFD